MNEFVPNMEEWTCPLRQMLKPQPPLRSQKQTEDVRQKAKDLPLLQISPDKNRIIQIDASVRYWTAILLEEHDGKLRIRGSKKVYSKNQISTTTRHSKRPQL